MKEGQFKLPIEYTNHGVLNDVVKDDLEFRGEESIYNKLLDNDSSFNILMPKYTSYYSKDTKFLKDTQKLLKRFKYDKSLHENQNITDDMQTNFTSFKSETSFNEKYQYITFSLLRRFNRNPFFMQCFSYYNLSSLYYSSLHLLSDSLFHFLSYDLKGSK